MSRFLTAGLMIGAALAVASCAGAPSAPHPATAVAQADQATTTGRPDRVLSSPGPGTAPPTNPFLLDSGGTDIQRSGSHFRTHSVRGTLSFRF